MLTKEGSASCTGCTGRDRSQSILQLSHTTFEVAKKKMCCRRRYESNGINSTSRFRQPIPINRSVESFTS